MKGTKMYANPPDENSSEADFLISKFAKFNVDN